MAANSAAPSGLASRYAAALFELADEQGQLDKVADDLAGLSSLLDESEDLRRLMTTPMMQREELARVIGEIGEKAGLCELTRKFLGVLARQRRLISFDAMARSFQSMLAARKGEVEAEVVSATPLDVDQLAALEASVASFAGKAVKVSASVDPELLGGVVVSVGSRMIDASLKTKLKQLELTMKGAR